MDHQEKIKALPNAPGVYLMKNAGGEVIYVGKATSLKKRVASYFRGTLVSARLDALVNAVADIEHIVTANEADALLLENALIKSKQPKYNVALRDDKTYLYLRIDPSASF
ncbi:MAG: GIY-YIG nuclease family protein, partial [Candidatus Omnitrophota bacterium]